MTEKKNPDEKKKRGRKSEYQKEYADQALKLCLLGAIDKELAEFFSVSVQTLNKWKKDYPEFLESLKKGKNIADANVASRLYNRAIGYSCKATKFATSEGRITDSKESTISDLRPYRAASFIAFADMELWKHILSTINVYNLINISSITPRELFLFKFPVSSSSLNSQFNELVMLSVNLVYCLLKSFPFFTIH